MKYRAGFLKVAFTCMVILMQSSNAGRVPKKHAAGAQCRVRELTELTKSLVDASLRSFDEANGKHLGNWTPGFPELQVHQNSTVQGSKVQCSLLFISEGLEKVLEDQKRNLNPTDVPLHSKLEDANSRVNLLAVCVKEILGGECSLIPSPPEMPKHAFEKKQWSHTFLKAARDYLDWLKTKIRLQISNVKGKNKVKPMVNKLTQQRYVEGSGYFL